MKRPKRPRDPAQLAKLMIDIASGEVEDAPEHSERGKNPAAVELGRLGGYKGGIARAASLTPEERKRIASEAAQARWQKKPPKT
jgi:hypothetical protein